MRKYISYYILILIGVFFLSLFVGAVILGGEGEAVEGFLLGMIIIFMLAAVLTLMLYMIDFLKKELRDIRLMTQSMRKELKAKKEGA